MHRLLHSTWLQWFSERNGMCLMRPESLKLSLNVCTVAFGDSAAK